MGILKSLKAGLISLAILVLFPVVAFAQEATAACDFDGVMGYFVGSGAFKAIASLVSVGVVMFFALTKKSMPGVIAKVLGFIGQALGSKSKP